MNIEVLTSWIGIICRGCGNKYRTRVRRGGTRCKNCGRQRYVRVNQKSEWTSENDKPYTARMKCTQCSHKWGTKAKPGSGIYCPRCRKSIHVPKARKAMREKWDLDPAPKPGGKEVSCGQCRYTWTTWAKPSSTIRCPQCKHPRYASHVIPTESREAPTAENLVDTLTALREMLIPQTSVSTSQKVQSMTGHRPQKTSPHKAARPLDQPRTQSSASQLSKDLRKIGITGGPMGPVNPAVNSGTCPMWDSRSSQYCNSATGWHVFIDRSTTAKVCEAHAYAVRHMANQSNIKAVIEAL